ncbi:MAG: hypothetical protein KC994_14475 [Candidatus Omnitrophica bacterium]|nr:hypothetical protein [Candidatus Omnitrophota bacterium]
MFSFLSTPLAECGVAVAMLLEFQKSGKTCEPAPKQDELDPQAEAVRKAWLKKFGDKWGLTENSDAEVVCSCTCCGDRCPMGAACCCQAPKYPMVDSGLLSLRGPGCRAGDKESPALPVSIQWVFLMTDQPGHAIPTSIVQGPMTSCGILFWIPSPESPPPEQPLRFPV